MLSNTRRFTKRVALLGALALALPLTLAACGEEDDPNTIVIGGSDVGIAALMIPALQQAGEENGLTIEYKPMAQSTAQVALINGDIEMGFMSFVNMAAAADQGTDVVGLAPTWAANTSLVVKKDSPYQTVEDLEGERVATLSRTISVYTESYAVLKDMGYDFEKDFEPFIVDSGGLLQGLLDKGEVEAITQYEPNTSRMLDSGNYREIFHTSTYWQDQGEVLSPSQNFAVRADWLEDQDVELLKKVALRATQIAAEDRSLYDEVSEGVNISTESGLDLLFERFGSLLIVDGYTDKNLARAQTELDEAHESGLTKKDHDVNDFVAGN